MATTTGVEVVGSDAVVVKRASGGAATIEALRREGERLRQASHPGVVSVIRSAPWHSGWELVLSHGGRSLATLDRPSVAEAATIVAGLASTLADLHEVGITHGRIDLTHVLLSEHGSPRLCGFGDGAQAGEPEDDVAALGHLLEQLLGADTEPEPIPERRWGARRRWRGWERRALLLLADQATVEDRSRRPSARRLAAAVAAAVPSSDGGNPAGQVPEVVDPIERLRPEPDAPPSSRPRRGLAIVMVVAGAVLVGTAALRLRTPDAISSPVAAPTGDVRVAEPVVGSVIVEDGQRYRVGQDGDHLLVADWACDGLPTAAAFRPSTREVFVFDRWTTTGPLTVRPTATVADAVEMISTPDGDGCPELAVRTADGEVVPVSLARDR